MRHYKHLSADERDRIAELHARHEKVSSIARDIGRDKSTVSRELARNGRHGRYGALKAQERADERRKACRPKRRLDDPALAREVRSRIVDDHWSPEQIDGRLRLERGRCVVSFATIYRAVNEGRMDAPGARGSEPVRRHLRRKGKKARRGREETRGRIRVSHGISERPAEAGERSRLGDWEDDTVVGPGGACLVGIVDRASRLLVGGKAGAHTAEAVGRVEVASLRGRPLETVTPDRGKEFAVNGNLEATSQGKAIFQPGQCASTIQVNTVSPSRAARIRSVRICGDGYGGSQDGDQPDRRDGYAQGDGRAPQLLGDGTQIRDGPAYGREVLEGRRRDGGRALCKAQRLRQIQG